MFYIDIFLKIANCEGMLYLDKYDRKGQHFFSLIHVSSRNYCQIPCVTRVECNNWCMAMQLYTTGTIVGGDSKNVSSVWLY